MMDLDVIIRTLASAERGDTLLEAIDSVSGQQGVRARPIVVVNGDRRDPRVMRRLARRGDVTLLTIEGGLKQALLVGRRAVRAPAFAFLDDDDEFLPGAALTRTAALELEPEADLVVANGLWAPLRGEERTMLDLSEVAANPLAALSHAVWLPSCGGTFRTGSFPPEWFDDLPPLFEWTWIAFKAAATMRLALLDQPTFRVHETPGSTSKSEEMALFQIELVRRLLTLDLPRAERRRVRRRLSAVLHSLSEDWLRSGRRLGALAFHLRCLAAPGGWRYLPYTWRLLGNGVRDGLDPSRRYAPQDETSNIGPESLTLRRPLAAVSKGRGVPGHQSGEDEA